MAIDEARLVQWLEESGALRRGHFQLSSGLHSAAYVQCALLLQHPARARAVGRELARRLAPQQPRSVLAPALGGVIIGHEVAAALGVPFRFTERQRGRMALRRGFAFGHQERFVLIEDVVTTGRSTGEAAAVAEEAGGRFCAVGAILDRSAGGNPFPVPFESLMKLDLPTFEAAECPMCRQGEELLAPGSRSFS